MVSLLLVYKKVLKLAVRVIFGHFLLFCRFEVLQKNKSNPQERVIQSITKSNL
mgnify:CR=1 FL=1